MEKKKVKVFYKKELKEAHTVLNAIGIFWGFMTAGVIWVGNFLKNDLSLWQNLGIQIICVLSWIGFLYIQWRIEQSRRDFLKWKETLMTEGEYACGHILECIVKTVKIGEHWREEYYGKIEWFDRLYGKIRVETTPELTGKIPAAGECYVYYDKEGTFYVDF